MIKIQVHKLSTQCTLPLNNFKTMFSILFGWSKASRCKKTIKRARRRLRYLKNKRQAMAMQLSKDLAELIKNGYQETAIKRVEQLIQDKSLLATYELLDQFFVFILEKLSYIRRHKDCPPDINEAVSSIMFASARCGDFPELYVIRKLFEQRYSEDYATSAMKLFPGNLVNKKLIEAFSVKSLTDDQKYKVIDEITRENCFQQEVKEHEGNQLVESDGHMNNTISETGSDNTFDSSSISKPSDSFSLSESTSAENNSALVYSVQQYYPPCGEEVEKEDFPDLQNKGETMALVPVPSSERVSLLPCAEATVEYYVEEIEESESFVSKDGHCQDQRLLSLSCDDSDIDQEESRSERSSIRVGFRKSKGAPKKRLRRRQGLLERQGTIEIECIVYYQKPCKSPSTEKYGNGTTQYRRMRKKPLLEGTPQSNYTSDKENCIIQSCQSQCNTKRKAFNLDLCECSLDQPCYCCFNYDQKCHSRAFTMIPEWPKNCNRSRANLLRTHSCPSPKPKHVHPKLPDCEDIVDIFTALKRERLEYK